MRYLIESFASFGSDTWCFGDDKEKVTTLCGQLNRNTGRTGVSVQFGRFLEWSSRAS
jgi:hypothetical protein